MFRAILASLGLLLAVVVPFAVSTPVYAMSSYLTGSSYLDGLNATDNYHAPEGTSYSGSISGQENVIPTTGTLTNLRGVTVGAPDAGDRWDITLYLNGSPTSMNVTLIGTNSTFEDTSHPIDVVPGDTVSIRTFSYQAGSGKLLHTNLEFNGDTSKESLVLGIIKGHFNETPYYGLKGTTSGDSTLYSDVYQVIPTSGVVSDMYLDMVIDPGDTGVDGYLFEVFHNEAVTNMSVNITADDTTGSDTTNSITVAAGEDVGVSVTPINVPANSPTTLLGAVFTADTDGESIKLFHSHTNYYSDSAERYTFYDKANSWGTTPRYMYPPGVLHRSLYVELENSPGAPGAAQLDGDPASNISGSIPWLDPHEAYSSNNNYAYTQSSLSTNSPSSNSGGNWTDPEDAYADGGAYANQTSGSGLNTWEDYGFDIGAIYNVTQVRVRYDAWTLGTTTNSTETKVPTAYETQTNLDGTIGDIDEDPDSPDANWGDAIDDGANVVAHVSFPAPTANLTEGANLQNFRVWVKRSTSDASPSIRMDLYENGGLVTEGILAATNITSDSGVLHNAYWDASDLADISGADVEAYILGLYAGAAESSAWTTPTSDNDPDAAWTDDSLAWNDATGDYAWQDISNIAWGNYFELHIASSQVDSVRVWSESESTKIDQISVDVYYSSAWNNIYEGALTVGSFQEYAIGSTETVTAMRIRYHHNQSGKTKWAGIAEADFNVVTPSSSSSIDVGAVEWNLDYTETTYDEQIKVRVSWDGGSSWSSEDTQTLTATETTYWFDVTGETSWVASMLDNGNLQVQAWTVTVGDASEVRLDWIPVEVTLQYYEHDNIWGTFGITGSGTISVVHVGVEGYASVAGNDLNIYTSNDGGGSWSSNSTWDNVDTSEATQWINVTDDWSWTWDMLSDANLQVELETQTESGSPQYYVDEVQVRVYYEADRSMTFAFYGQISGATDLEVVIAGTNTTGSNTSDSYTVQTPELMTLRASPSGTPSVGVFHMGVVAYVPVGAAPNISNTPSSKGLGVVQESSSYWSNGVEPAWPINASGCYFNVTNNSGAAVDITIVATNFTGGVGWALTSGSPGENTVRLRAGKVGDANEAAMVIITTGSQSFITSLADGDSMQWEIKLETGTFTDGVVKENTITLTASLS